MFDIGFWELLVIAIVLLLVMGPERLPEVARQAAFLVRKARQGMFRLRSEMQSEMDATPFADIQKARQEMTDLKNDFKQFGRELADSAEQKMEVASAPNDSGLNATEPEQELKSDIKDTDEGKPSKLKYNDEPAKTDGKLTQSVKSDDAASKD